MNLLSHQEYWFQPQQQSTYALTNPNTWPSGVFVRLVIESGAIVAGRGGDGGRGGRAFMMTLGIKCIGSITVAIAPIRQAWYTVKRR